MEAFNYLDDRSKAVYDAFQLWKPLF